MFIFKNALKNLTRSKGRNLLIGIIVFVIAVSACLGLSIRQASEKAKAEAMESLTVTAQISIDRESMMQNMHSETDNTNSNGQPSFDRDSFKQNFQEIESLTIDEMLTYAEASTVQSFDYNLTVSMNGSVSFEAVSSTIEEEDETSEEESSSSNMMMGMGGMMQGGQMGDSEMSEKGPGGFRKGSFGTQGDFTLTGYSSDAAMTSFIDQTCTITEGEMFEEGTEEYVCVISDELALYNNIDLVSNSAITITNPNDEEETYTLTVVGIYNNSQATVTTGGMMGGFSTSTDPANQIYMSYTALKSIVDTSEANATTETDEDTGIETTTAIPGQTSGTYSFASVEDYETFEKEVYELGLSEDYAVSSSDVNSYTQSLLPLNNLNEMALYFLWVVLGIGAVILIVLNIFSVRERKYEVGVLTAVGMKKSKVSLQFLIETLIVTFVAVLIGAAVGGVASVSVTNSLLESQVAAQEEETASNTESFGREMNERPNMGGGQMGGGQMGNESGGNPQSGGGRMEVPKGMEDNEFANKAVDYINEVDSAMDLTVLLQLLGIGLGLTLIASAASIIFIMRYEPLKILANRD